MLFILSAVMRGIKPVQASIPIALEMTENESPELFIVSKDQTNAIFQRRHKKQ